MRKLKDSAIIGLTGPIASGKNTVAGIFGRHKAYVIDVDNIGHKVISSQSQQWHEIVKTFGSHVLNRGGIVNRRKLAAMVFSDKKLLKKLNKIAHPAILKEVKTLIKKAKRLKRKFIIVNAAVLKEIGLIPYVDYVITVLSSKDKRFKRLRIQGLARKEALLRINSQKSDREYKKIADFMIYNNKTKANLQKSVKELISKIG